MILYLLQSTFALSLLIFAYYAFLRHTSYFRFNRVYLLGSLVLSLLVPCFAIELAVNEPAFVNSYRGVSELYSTTDYSTENILILGKQKATPFQRFSYYFLLISYSIVSGFFIIRFSVNLYLLLICAKEKGPQLKGMQSVFITRNTGPFSFFNYLFVTKETLSLIRESESVLLHEKAHSLQKHSIDILFVELTCCFLWFHPMVWLYKKAIKENHEYLADQYAIANHSNFQQYQQDLILAIQKKSYSSLTSSFSYLKIKNRIKMINQKQPSSALTASKIVFSSLFACATLLLCSFKPIALENQYNSTELNFESTTPSILPIDINQIIAIRSEYGMRMNPITKAKQMHTGVDISAPAGTPIIATADGIIEKANFSEGYGNHVKITHNSSFTTMYAHLKSMNVKAGQNVKTGDVIGIIGNTGRSLGRHLHYEVIKNNKKVDPANYFQYEILEK